MIITVIYLKVLCNIMVFLINFNRALWNSEKIIWHDLDANRCYRIKESHDSVKCFLNVFTSWYLLSQWVFRYFWRAFRCFQLAFWQIMGISVSLCTGSLFVDSQINKIAVCASNLWTNELCLEIDRFHSLPLQSEGSRVSILHPVFVIKPGDKSFS